MTQAHVADADDRTGAVFGLGAVKFLQIQAAIAQAASFQPPPEAVTTIVARQEQWPATLDADRHGGRRPGRHA